MSACGTCSVPCPSLEKSGASVLDEFYWLNKKDPNYSPVPGHGGTGAGDAPHRREVQPEPEGACMEIMRLFMTPATRTCTTRPSRTSLTTRCSPPPSGCTGGPCLPIENWHSALEMKLYFQRFIHHIAGLPDFSALKFTRYNQYESLILPCRSTWRRPGVDFRFGTERSPT